MQRNCPTCGQKIRKKSKKMDIIEEKLPIINPAASKAIANAPSLPVFFQFSHQGFWITDKNGQHVPTTDKKCNRNSVMLRNDCLLYVYKLALRHFLLSIKAVQPNQIDPANLVPHTVVRKNSNDPFSKYDSISKLKKPAFLQKQTFYW